MSRILARDCGFKMVFQWLFNKDFDIENTYEEFSLTEEEKTFSYSLFLQAKNHIDDINNKILSNLKNNLKLTDIYKLDYAILVATISQIDYLEESLSLSINEAVELAKKYSTEKSPKFINGVLSSIYNQKKG